MILASEVATGPFMNSTAQEEIDAVRKVLEEAKSYSGLGPDDPSVVALEQIMNDKIDALEAAKTHAAPGADVPRAITTGEQSPSPPDPAD